MLVQLRALRMNLPKIARCIVRAPAYVGAGVSFFVVVVLVLLIALTALMCLFFARAAGLKVTQG